MPDPFPEELVARFLAGATALQRAWLAAASAQRAWSLAQAILGAVDAADRHVVDDALEACWVALGAHGPGDPPSLIPRLEDRLVDDADAAYGFYNSVVNDAVASTIYAVLAAPQPGDDITGAHDAAQTFYNIVDFVLHQGRLNYIDDLSTSPMIVYAADCIERDTEILSRLSDIACYRDSCIADGSHLAALAERR